MLILGSTKGFEGVYVAEGEEQGDGAAEAEAAIAQAPEERDAADGAGDERKGKHTGTGDEAELEEPAVADGVASGADEGGREDEVGEGEPVCAVGEIGVVAACVDQG